MGTTADKLEAVLNSKNAIRDKFGIPDSVPFSEYADLIQSGDEVTLGYIDNARQFQALTFNGNEASNNGTPEKFEEFCTWKTPEIGERLSYEELHKKVEAGEFTTANFGETITLPFPQPFFPGKPAEMSFEIVDIDRLDLDGKHSITLWAKEPLCLGNMATDITKYYQSSVRYGEVEFGWPVSILNTFLQDFLKILPNEFVQYIVSETRTVRKTRTRRGSTPYYDIVYSEDYLFLPTARELRLQQPFGEDVMSETTRPWLQTPSSRFMSNPDYYSRGIWTSSTFHTRDGFYSGAILVPDEQAGYKVTKAANEEMAWIFPALNFA